MPQTTDNLFGNIGIQHDLNIPVSSDTSLSNVDDQNLKEQIRARYVQDTQFRKHLAYWVMSIVPVWLLVVLTIVFFNGFELTRLDSSVMISLLATTTVNVLGLAYIVLKGIFNQR